jgi:alpha-beta hydrolase superfamily lysophospholipase
LPALLVLGGAVTLVNAGPAGAAHYPEPGAAATATRGFAAGSTGGQEATPPSPPPAQPARLAVGLRVLRLVDDAHTIRLPGGRTQPRTLLTYVRYPALGAPDATDVPNAPAARAAAPFPLVIFGHGFDVAPQAYAHLLAVWTRAGYVVAAPVFPLTNPGVPGGPDESDLANQPHDMSLVISRLLALSGADAGPLSGLIDPTRIAVAGQSDGGATALAAAYSHRVRDPRVGAAVILSGAEISGVGGYGFYRGSPPLLAVQGTADTINEPRFTDEFFNATRRPKYLLRLLGARHLPPYTRQQPQLAIVERVTIAFLDAYLKRVPGALRRLVSAGGVPGLAAVTADP